MKTSYLSYRYIHIIFICCIALLCAFIYSNTLHTPFVFDDLNNIQENTFLRLSALDLNSIYQAASEGPSSTRPISKLSFALNYYFGGYDVYGYHLFNIIIHFINSALVYFISFLTLKQLERIKPPIDKNKPDVSPLIAIITALIFLSHPLQTQSVTYIVQRMNS